MGLYDDRRQHPHSRPLVLIIGIALSRISIIDSGEFLEIKSAELVISKTYTTQRDAQEFVYAFRR